jgi:hypothetical protein
MTRKHFEAIARTINEQLQAVRTRLAGRIAEARTPRTEGDTRVLLYIQGQEEALLNTAQAFSDTLAEVNPRFNAQRFLDACLKS